MAPRLSPSKLKAMASKNNRQKRQEKPLLNASYLSSSQTYRDRICKPVQKIDRIEPGDVELGFAFGQRVLAMR